MNESREGVNDARPGELILLSLKIGLLYGALYNSKKEIESKNYFLIYMPCLILFEREAVLTLKIFEIVFEVSLNPGNWFKNMILTSIIFSGHFGNALFRLFF